jgi:hypothetical protein
VSRFPSGVLLVVIAVVLVPGCDSGGGAGEAGPRRSSESSPVRVGFVPEGYALTVVGRGRASQYWGDDSAGTHEPFTVLAPEGADASSPEAVIVSVTGFEGYEGGLDQASSGYVSGEEQRFRLDGRDAIYTPRRTDLLGEQRWADLVAIRGTDVAVRVTARDATRKQLVEVLRRVSPSQHRSQAPTVPDPPAGLRVVGSVDADAVVALERATVELGPPSAHGAAWRQGPAGLAVVALPGRSAELAALAGFRVIGQWNRVESRSREVAGRSGLVLDGAGAGDGGFPRRAVVTYSQSGDLLIVVADTRDQRGQLLSEEDLIAVAASARQGDDAVAAGLSPPFGPPPTDEAGARAAVTTAATAWSEAVSAGGARFDLVDDPHALDVALSEARRNFPRELTESTLQVSEVQFLDATHAQFTYNLMVPGRTFADRIGQAVLIDGTWKLTRESICNDLLLASVTCPP